MENALKIPTDSNEYPYWVNRLVKQGKVAEIYLSGTEREIDEGLGVPAWKGDLDSVLFIGYPYLTNEPYKWDDDDKPIKFRPILSDIGIPLINLYWSSDHHCFVCVRSDVYSK